MKASVATSASVLILLSGPDVEAQTVLPTVTISEPESKAKPAKAKSAQAKPTAKRANPARRAAPSPSPPAQSASGGRTSSEPAISPQLAAARAGESEARTTRARLLPQAAASASSFGKAKIDALPGGNQTGFNQVLLNLPGVTQDSTGSGEFHIRNEHSNVQYRVNGIFLPEGVSGFSQVLDSVFVRNLTLLDGALPAQYGLRTSGVIDIEARTGADAPGTIASMYGGSNRTLLPTLTTSGTSGRWDYFVTGRYLGSALGIENPQPTQDAIHDNTRQGRYFAFVSGQLEDSSRVTFMSGASSAAYQIPNAPGRTPAFTAYGISDFNSVLLDENQREQSLFNVLAWQKSLGAFDSQVSYFQRYSTLRFKPDRIGDILFNGVASDVSRLSLVNGLQTDNAWRTSARNTIRFGAIAYAERGEALDSNIVLPLNAAGTPIDRPTVIANEQRRTGFVGGLYLQDEYYLTPKVAVTGGLRYDAMNQYVTADQLSPRLGIVYKPSEATTFHAGYARYFTPPPLALSAPSPLAPFANTTLAPATSVSNPARPERAHYVDVGITHRLLPGLDVGVDLYYKLAKNLIDSGQFGSAVVLTSFNYDRATNQGVEVSANYQRGAFSAFANLAVAKQRATLPTSNQYLFTAAELAFASANYVPTDHDQLITLSGGASYRLFDTVFSTNVIYGSGLRNGFANLGTVAPHAVVNVGLAHDFKLSRHLKPTTFRLNVVNLFDNSYLLRDGSGIGVFQVQYGARRGIFAGLAQAF